MKGQTKIMRLYLNANSKLHISYTPDTLLIGDLCIDLNGDTDGIDSGLTTRTKGEFSILTDTDSRPITQNDINYIKNNLKNVVISIYPFTERDESLINTDELTNCSGTLFIDNQQIDFNFTTIFYGI